MKSVFITGGGQGIGLESAKIFAANGYKVGIADLDDTLFTMVSRQVPGVSCFEADVTDFTSIQEALSLFAKSCGGKLNILINNAGIVEVGEFADQPLEQHHQIIDVNLKGVINTTYAALSFLRATSPSVIINMSSASALYGNPEITTYAATKSAIKSLTEGWSLSFRKYNVRVCDILPIYVKTRMVTQYAHRYRNLEADKVKLTAEDVAQTIWKAAGGKRLHYLVGSDTKAYALLLKWLPGSWLPVIVRKVLRYND